VSGKDKDNNGEIYSLVYFGFTFIILLTYESIFLFLYFYDLVWFIN
jgi:hypothetical protein